MSQEMLIPCRQQGRRRPQEASVLLHAIVCAIRDEACHDELRKLVAHYPRIMNRANPYTPLFDEIARLRSKLEENGIRP